KLDLVDDKKHDIAPTEEKKEIKNTKFEPTEQDKDFIRELQKNMDIIDEPFVNAANNLGLTENEVFEKMKHYEDIGVMRRFAAILRHRQIGFTANGMIVWKVDNDKISEVGSKLGSFPQVSHCYERPTYPDWPYNVFSMIHCKTQDEAYDVAKTIQDQIHVDDYNILFSTREFKKTRVEYFVENSFSLEEIVST
ncbi:MAG: Lrp/AsnC family transcriptional regulator, partial [Thaumarchaeota archaeon]|nr:Lrp/AsnC family transcriptional regulator [Nitrososphaerota archaeon]